MGNSNSSSGEKIENVDDFISKAIENNKVTVFSKTWCGYCSRAKNIFSAKGQAIHVVEIDSYQNGDEMQSKLGTRTKVRTVPQIFIDRQFIG